MYEFLGTDTDSWAYRTGRWIGSQIKGTPVETAYRAATSPTDAAAAAAAKAYEYTPGGMADAWWEKNKTGVYVAGVVLALALSGSVYLGAKGATRIARSNPRPSKRRRIA